MSYVLYACLILFLLLLFKNKEHFSVLQSGSFQLNMSITTPHQISNILNVFFAARHGSLSIKFPTDDFARSFSLNRFNKNLYNDILLQLKSLHDGYVHFFFDLPSHLIHSLPQQHNNDHLITFVIHSHHHSHHQLLNLIQDSDPNLRVSSSQSSPQIINSINHMHSKLEQPITTSIVSTSDSNLISKLQNHGPIHIATFPFSHDTHDKLVNVLDSDDVQHYHKLKN